jgi:hypothetical protein
VEAIPLFFFINIFFYDFKKICKKHKHHKNIMNTIALKAAMDGYVTHNKTTEQNNRTKQQNKTTEQNNRTAFKDI